ncbi:uncharacterized protein YALI1_E24180g [Yarrowia lipolytica]|uniref:Uncharacterized protein n=1 Tax=Yarrowia lipolytica TaxID=4952 RepID=A0A1D8NJ98_YARLL|nr:hypothetical protein YALI1_E24180g [Yarrowia lipolytica]
MYGCTQKNTLAMSYYSTSTRQVHVREQESNTVLTRASPIPNTHLPLVIKAVSDIARSYMYNCDGLANSKTTCALYSYLPESVNV